MDKRKRTDNTMAKRKRTDNTMTKRKRTDNTMAKRKRTDNTMAKRKRTNDLQNIHRFRWFNQNILQTSLLLQSTSNQYVMSGQRNQWVVLQKRAIIV